MCRKIEIKKLHIFQQFYSLNWNYPAFSKPKVGPNTWPMYKVYHNRSFHHIVALKTKACVMALLVPTWSKLSPNLIKTSIPYRSPMGSWLGIGISTLPWTPWIGAISGTISLQPPLSLLTGARKAILGKEVGPQSTKGVNSRYARGLAPGMQGCHTWDLRIGLKKPVVLTLNIHRILNWD